MIFHEPFDPDEARAAAALSAYPDPIQRAPLSLVPRPMVVGARDVPEPDRSWMDQAACIGRVDEFFPRPRSGDSHTFRAELANAVAICSTCPVRDDCEQYAKDTEPSDGVWAGVLYERGRPRITRKRPARVPQNRHASGYSLLTLIESASWSNSGEGVA